MIRGTTAVVNSINIRNISLDSDAEIFIDTLLLTEPIIINAINTLVLDLKNAGLWVKKTAIYPFVGGTSDTHKYNLKDPRDTDDAFRLDFIGGWVHSGTGILPNGIDTYANTFINPSVELSRKSVNFTYYSRTDSVGNADIGLDTYSPPYTYGYIRKSGGTSNWRINTSNSESSSANSNSLGFFAFNRALETPILYDYTVEFSRQHQNNNLGAQSLTLSTGTSSGNFLLGGMFNGTEMEYGNKECAFASFGEGLSLLESQLLYQIVEKFQYTLGRNVNADRERYYDPGLNYETNAHIFNGGLTNSVQISILDSLVSTLKTENLWQKMIAVYPVIGGTSQSHKLNLILPIDETEAFAIAFVGGWSHSSTGMIPSGTSEFGYAFANPLLTPATKIQVNKLSGTPPVWVGAHLSFYSRTSTPGGGFDIGTEVVDNNTTPQKNHKFYLGCGGSASTSTLAIACTDANRVVYSNTDSSGYYIGTRPAPVGGVHVLKSFKNGVLKGTNNTNPVSDSTIYSMPSSFVYIGAMNKRLNTNGIYDSSSIKECAFATVGMGLTDADVTKLNTAVDVYQTALGRKV